MHGGHFQPLELELVLSFASGTVVKQVIAKVGSRKPLAQDLKA